MATIVDTTLPLDAVVPVTDNVLIDAVVEQVPVQDDAMTALAAAVRATKDAETFDKDAVNKFVKAIGERITDAISRDFVIAHTLLLAVFHFNLRHEKEAKDLAYLCSAETRYIAYLDMVAKTVAKDASVIENLPLPPLDVAMFWHSHMLSPLRYADDICRRYGRAMLRIDFPLMRLAKVLSGNDEDLVAARAFWTAHMPADQPFDLVPADFDETMVDAKVACASCQDEQTLTMPEYAVFRLHKQAHTCTSCSTAFTAEHAAVRRFLTIVKRAPLAAIAGTRIHPKTLMAMGKHRGNVRDLKMLFHRAAWAKRVAALPALPTWADIESTVFAPIMAATKDKLVLPGNQRRFSLVQSAFEDVTTGPWSMDMVRAVRRQRRFSGKIAKYVQSGAHAVFHFHTEALAQYPKFLAATVVRPADLALVPTSEIDLAWHTHQLFPTAYAQSTLEVMGHVINHNDSDDEVSEARIAKGVEAMPEFWMRLFAEDYFHPEVKCTWPAVHVAGKAVEEARGKDAARCKDASAPKDAAWCKVYCGNWCDVSAAGKDASAPKDAAWCKVYCGNWCDVSSAGKDASAPKDAAWCKVYCGNWCDVSSAGKDASAPKDAAWCKVYCGNWCDVSSAGKDASAPKDAARCKVYCGTWCDVSVAADQE
ncbi:hypothetical protein GGF32_002965 [Allomyces javanicus]|nr:hypothetical protein GGF32_002965 [Allomyces javanicus]